MLMIRGDTASFLQDDDPPSWEEYSAPITRTWRYVQVREATALDFPIVPNFIQAVLWAVVLVLLVSTGVDERFFVEMARAGVLVNLVMWAFNLFPLPPLDGGRILVGLLPWKQAHMVSRIEPWGFFIVMGLVVAGVLGSLWLRPLMGLGYSAINLLLTPLTALLR